MSSGILLIALAVVLGPQSGPSSDRLYGRLLTAGGERLEGYLRWDRNETHWADFLDGQKEIPWEHVREAERLDDEFRRLRELERSISLPGLRISWDEDDEDDPLTAASGIRFGHVTSIEVLDERRALLRLKSGEEMSLRGGSTDLGRSFRSLVVEDSGRGEVELRWRDLARVDFMSAPANRQAPTAGRLRGTLRTRGGAVLTGFVAWDLDETLTTDILDGRDGRRRHEVEFGRIARIERDGSTRARVTLRSGEVITLRGTNDVNAENRGIEITDPTLGRMVVRWDQFESLAFDVADDGLAPYGAFEGGRALRGTVETRDGVSHAGRLRWDNDESFSWELLDGRSEGVQYGVELAAVRTIDRVGLSAARVGLRDGRSLVLEGASDVSEDNRGIFVTGDEGDTVLVRWRDFQRVRFVE